MTLQFQKLNDRKAAGQKANIVLLGESGVGKTYLGRTLDPTKTLFIDGEAGTISLGEWNGTVLNVREQSVKLGVHPWELCRAIACLLAGPDPAANGGPYCRQAFDQYCQILGEPSQFEGFDTIYVDSITVASRWSFEWAKTQPEAMSKDGKPDTRSTYGFHGREMVSWLTQLQHQPKSIVVSCILDKKTDDYGRVIFEPQVVGGMAGREMPGIFDVVLTLAWFETEDGVKYRAFATQKENEWGYPAKDRSSLLSDLEEPNLGKLLAKITTSAPAVQSQPQVDEVTLNA